MLQPQRALHSIGIRLHDRNLDRVPLDPVLRDQAHRGQLKELGDEITVVHRLTGVRVPPARHVVVRNEYSPLPLWTKNPVPVAKSTEPRECDLAIGTRKTDWTDGSDTVITLRSVPRGVFTAAAGGDASFAGLSCLITTVGGRRPGRSA